MNNNKVHSLNALFFFFGLCITYKVLKSIIIVRRLPVTLQTVFEFSRIYTREKIIFFTKTTLLNTSKTTLVDVHNTIAKRNLLK